MFTYKKYKDCAILTSYQGKEKKVYVPETIDGLKISRIASMCFFGIDEIEEISFPDNISIENNAIVDCQNLKVVYISKVSKLGNFIEDCDDVQIITSDSSSSKKMKNQNLENVYDVSIFEIWKTSDTAAKIMKIKNIKKANGPKKIKIPNFINGLKITELADYLFYDVNIEEVILNDFVEELPKRCFSSTYIRSIKNLDHIKKIEENCFNGAYIDEELYFPNLEEVSAAGFYNSNFDLEVGNKIKNIGNYGFGYSRIKEINLSKHNEVIKSSAFVGCNLLKRVTLPKTIKTLEASAFEACSALIEVKNLNNVMFFGKEVFAACDSFVVKVSFDKGKVFKENAFYEANLPQKITIKDCILEDSAFAYANKVKTVIFTNEYKKDYISRNLFYNTETLSKIVLNDTITTIKEHAFRYCKLKEINLDSIKVIEKYAFAETLLKSIHLPNVERLDLAVFEKCYNLKHASFYGNKLLEEFPTYLFYGCNLESIIFPENLKTLGTKCFFNCNFKEMKLPYSIEKIKESFIGNNSKLEYLEIPSNVKYFEESCLSDIYSTSKKGTKIAIYGNPELKRTNIFSSSKFQGTLDLSNCIMEVLPVATFKYLQVKELILPKNIKKIGNYAFCNSKIDKLVMDYDSIEEVGYSAFANSNIENLQVPKNAKIFRSNCFFESHLKIDELELVANQIEDSAFYSAGRIKEIIIKVEPTILEKDNFVYCGITKISSTSSKVLSRLKSRRYFKNTICEFKKIK